MKKKKKDLSKLSDQELLLYYKKVKKEDSIWRVASPAGSFIVAAATANKIAAFVPAVTAYLALGCVYSGKLFDKVDDVETEIENRDSIRRRVFEEKKKKGFSKKQRQIYKKKLELQIILKNSYNESYSLNELEKELILNGDDENIIDKLKENQKKEEELIKLGDKCDNLIDDFLFLLSDDVKYLETLDIPPKGFPNAYKSNSSALDDDTIFYQDYKGISLEPLEYLEPLEPLDILDENDKN